MKILLATNNLAKIKRVKNLLADVKINIISPQDLNIEAAEVREGSNIEENAQQKALAYRDLTDLPILANDTAFVMNGEKLDPAQVKRNALNGTDESSLTQDEIAQRIISFYKNLVQRRGENIPAYWEDCFALVLPDKTVKIQKARRPVLLTDEIKGKIDPYFPLRSMYIVEPTGKYTAEQNEKEMQTELRPLKEALKKLIF